MNQKKRLARSAAIVVVALIAIAGISWAIDSPRCGIYQQFAQGFAETDTPTLSAEDGLQTDMDAWLKRLGLPDAFEEEVFEVASFREVFVAAKGTVVGLLSNDDAAVLQEKCRALLMRSGWRCAGPDNEQPGVRCYLKDTGRYHLIYVEVTDTGRGSTAILTLA